MKQYWSDLFKITSCLVLVLVFASNQAHAGAKIDFDGDKYVTLGAGLRTSFLTAEDASPDGNNWSSDLDLNSIRLYTGGKFHEMIEVEFNTDIDSADDVHVLDAIVKFTLNEKFNIWVGRHLPPSDRYNLDGAYYLATWDFPTIVSRYPAIFIGRDDGVSVSGQWEGGKIKYAIGAYEGLDTAANANDSLLYAGRLTYNFWDPEPGYYASSTYYGDKDVLAVGLVVQQQSNGAVDSSGVGQDFLGYNIDVLMETKMASLGDGVLTLEGAAYNYDADGATIDGDAYMGLVAFLFPQKIGWGQFQPHFRVQESEGSERYDVGVNYVIKGHNARISLVYSNTDTPTTSALSQILLGAQLQY